MTQSTRVQAQAPAGRIAVRRITHQKNVLFAIGFCNLRTQPPTTIAENLYLDIIDKQPDSSQARLALAENYEKKGDLDVAINTCLQILEKDPNNTSAHKHLVQLYHKVGRNEDAVNMALDLIDASPDKKESFVCDKCNHKSKQLFWHCPDCGSWQSAKRN